jgi:hypothetical protein
MVAKGNRDSHRYSYSGGVKAVETEKYGRDKARERYGELKYEDGAPRPEDRSAPQRLGDANNLRGPLNDVAENSWLRGGGKK